MAHPGRPAVEGRPLPPAVWAVRHLFVRVFGKMNLPEILPMGPYSAGGPSRTPPQLNRSNGPKKTQDGPTVR